jgi:hypothetical protein
MRFAPKKIAFRHFYHDIWGTGCIDPHVLDLGTSEWSDSCPCCFTPGEIGGWVDPRDFSLYSPVNVGDEVSQPGRTIRKIIISYILLVFVVVVFLDSRRQEMPHFFK